MICYLSKHVYLSPLAMYHSRLISMFRVQYYEAMIHEMSQKNLESMGMLPLNYPLN